MSAIDSSTSTKLQSAAQWLCNLFAPGQEKVRKLVLQPDSIELEFCLALCNIFSDPSVSDHNYQNVPPAGSGRRGRFFIKDKYITDAIGSTAFVIFDWSETAGGLTPVEITLVQRHDASHAFVRRLDGHGLIVGVTFASKPQRFVYVLKTEELQSDLAALKNAFDNNSKGLLLPRVVGFDIIQASGDSAGTAMPPATLGLPDVRGMDFSRGECDVLLNGALVESMSFETWWSVNVG
jgi:hypothetical protein